MTQTDTQLVTNRYKITGDQDRQLRELSENINVPVSALVRLAINCFLPRTKSLNLTDKKIAELWNTNKF